MVDRQNYSSDQERRSCCGRFKQMQFSFGEDLSMTPDKTGSTVQFSETNRNSDRLTSFAKRAILLGRSGLIAGVTPTSIRGRSEALILGTVFSLPGGGGVRN